MTEDRHVRPFAEFLQSHARGALHDALSEGLSELIEAVTVTGRKGTLTLKLSVTAESDNVVSVVDDVKVAPPVTPRKAGIYFVTDDYQLSRRDPRQPELPLAPVAVPSEPTQETQAQ